MHIATSLKPSVVRCAQANGSVTTQELAYLTWAVGAEDYTARDTQRSAPLYLAAGQPVLLESAYFNGPDVGYMGVGVTVPSTTASAASVPEEQIINVEGHVQSRIVEVLYRWGTGPLWRVYNITVTSAVVGEALRVFARSCMHDCVCVRVRACAPGALRPTDLEATPVCAFAHLTPPHLTWSTSPCTRAWMPSC